jgi:GH25 family lysozyme M1 (1,4-beta-N-acetylmuramidase)
MRERLAFEREIQDLELGLESASFTPASAITVDTEKFFEVNSDRGHKTAYRVKGKSPFYFRTNMSTDYDGAPTAYHPSGRRSKTNPNGKALDWTANAGKQAKDGKPANWYGIVTTNGRKDGIPYVQKEGIDPYPGFYVSPTSLGDDRIKRKTDPRKYVDASRTPYIALPPEGQNRLIKVPDKAQDLLVPTKHIEVVGGKRKHRNPDGAELGDFSTVINMKNKRIAHAIFADSGPWGKLGEGSLALGKALGRKGDEDLDLVYVVFPKSRHTRPWPVSVEDINTEGDRLFRQWGGMEQLNALFPPRRASPVPFSTAPATDIGLVSSIGTLLGSLADRFSQLVRSGQERLAIAEAFRNRHTDVNQLANMVFFARHPELKGRKLRPDERALTQEWLQVRDTLVQPTVARLNVEQSVSALPLTPVAPVGAAIQGSLFLGLDTYALDGNKVRDWVKAKAEGSISFAIFQSNYGNFRSRTFAREWPKIKDAGIVRGAYLFLRFPNPKADKKFGPAPTPLAQARAFIDTVKLDRYVDLPPAFDVEFPGHGGWKLTGMGQQQLLDRVRVAWKVLKDYYGVAPIIYTSARVWRHDLGDPEAPDLIESPLWLTPYPFGTGGAAVHNPEAFVSGGRYHPPPVPRPWGVGNWWIHQYQGDAVQLPGFATGNVDMNRFNTMAKGETGNRVTWAQRRLGIAQTGAFDAAMETALRTLQEKNGLVADGVIDPRTFVYLCWSNP